MRKALNDTSDRLKLVDIVYETCDARIPLSSRNPELNKIIGGKTRILILNKSDLADPSDTDKWVKYFALFVTCFYHIGVKRKKMLMVPHV